MSTIINLSEADFDLLRNKLVEFLSRNASQLKDYNFNTSALSGLVDALAYTASYMAANNNMAVTELLMDTATLEKTIYTLIHNFNYIPKLKTPAKEYLRVRYYRSITNSTVVNYTATLGTFVIGDVVTGAVGGATGTVDVVDTTSFILYLKDTTGDWTLENAGIQNAGATATGTVTSTSVGTGDGHSDDDADKFQLYFNYLDYTSEYKAIPTFRDKYVESQYTTLNITTDDVNIENKAVFLMEPYIDTTNNIRYLQSIIPLYQAEWQQLELENINNTTFEQIVYLSDDGTINGTMFGDKVIGDTIRVYVYEDIAGAWFEYKNVTKGNFDQANKRAFKLKYDQEYGIFIKFNVEGYCREILDNDDIRVFFVTTEGEDINEEDGTNLFSNDESNLKNVGYSKIENTTDTVDLYEASGDGTTYSLITGDADYIEYQIIDANVVTGTATFLTNGVAKQTVADIKEAAPLHHSTQGRAVTESDYNSLLRKRYSEYYDIRAWGGNKEFIEMLQIVTDAITNAGGLPITDTTTAVSMVKEALGTMYFPSVYDNAYLTVKNVTQDTLESGDHIRDKGYVYFTIAANNFQFETNSDAINDVKAYLDEYKILSIYYKYMYPTYAILQPVINLKLKSAYTKTFALRDIKQDIYDFINKKSKTVERFNLSSLYSEINAYEEVDYVDTVNFTVNAKVKNQSVTDYTYVRLYTPISTDINTTVNGKTFVTSVISSPTDPYYGYGKVTIDGSDVGYINYTTGIMRYQYDFGISEYYIEGIEISGNNVVSTKDCYYGTEFLSDITINVE